MEKENNILLVDLNEGIDICLAISRDLKEQVDYFIPWQVGCPKLEDSKSGDGFEELNKIYDMKESKAETIFFLDLGFSSTIVDLKEEGYNVWGATPLVEKMETDRIYGKKKAIELGLAVTDYEVVTGVSNVVKYFEEHKGKHFVKINLFRGTRETFSADSPESVKVILDACNLGIYAELLDFVIEPPAEGAEISLDAFFSKGKFLKKHYATIEIKGVGNLGQWVDDSLFVEQFMKPLESFLAEQEFCGNISAEGFWDGKIFKVMDFCMRVPYPCSSSWAFDIKNFGKFMMTIAADEGIDFEVKYPYSAHVDVYNSSPTSWKKITIDEKKLDNKTKAVGFKRTVKKEDGYYFVPGDTLMGTGLGQGNSWEEAIKNAIEAADAFSALDCSTSGTVFSDFEKTVKKCEDLGFKI